MLDSIEITYKVKAETDILFKVLKNSRKLDQNIIIETFDNSFKVSKLDTMKIFFLKHIFAHNNFKLRFFL